jgi:hypothetical protein
MDRRKIRKRLILLFFLAGFSLLFSQAEADAPADPFPVLPDSAFPDVEDPRAEFGHLDPRVFRAGLELELGALGIVPQMSALIDLSGGLGYRFRLAGRAGFSWFLPLRDEGLSPFYIPLGLALRFPPFLTAELLYFLPLDGNWNTLLLRAGGGADYRVMGNGKTELYVTLQLLMALRAELASGETTFPFGAKAGLRLNF